ncbi:hypothetical protein [Devosia nitrariae]|uniref:PepSY domain-containing protein n=1 Tax=Devosia nitrariae TaxID=2071872 RepID=A0ABQ5WD68_9HYPH|nr:hypothetical protein [Devosia nitrariae]GLQ57704.1 hypothetical protein GCM10010862_49630 [Devosia nitrariae]
MAKARDLPKRLAAAIAMAILAAGGPVAAQPFSAFGLQFNWEDSYEPRGPELGICMTDRQIRQAIAARGYGDIALNVRRDRRIQVRATQGGHVFLLEFDFCNNTIIERRALR